MDHEKPLELEASIADVDGLYRIISDPLTTINDMILCFILFQLAGEFSSISRPLIRCCAKSVKGSSSSVFHTLRSPQHAIVEMESGSTTVFSFLQSAKAPRLICFIVPGKVMVVKSTHPSKAFSSIVVTPSGITISLMSPGKSPKVPLWIVVLFVKTFSSLTIVSILVSLPIFNSIILMTIYLYIVRFLVICYYSSLIPSSAILELKRISNSSTSSPSATAH